VRKRSSPITRKKSWTSPLAAERVSVPGGDAFALQLAHFAAVVRDGAAPLVTGREGQPDKNCGDPFAIHPRVFGS